MRSCLGDKINDDIAQCSHIAISKRCKVVECSQSKSTEWNLHSFFDSSNKRMGTWWAIVYWKSQDAHVQDVCGCQISSTPLMPPLIPSTEPAIKAVSTLLSEDSALLCDTHTHTRAHLRVQSLNQVFGGIFDTSVLLKSSLPATEQRALICSFRSSQGTALVIKAAMIHWRSPQKNLWQN